MQGKVGIGAAQARNEVIFEHSDGAFCLVASVCMWWYELVVDLVVG